MSAAALDMSGSGAGDADGGADAGRSRASGGTPQRDVARFLRLLFVPGDVFEVRAPKCRERQGSNFVSTHAGYYTHATINKAAADIAALDKRGLAPGIYITLNPVKPDLLARAADRLQVKAVSTTKDTEIVVRRWMLVDLDPCRPEGVSSTDTELAAARERGETIVAALRAEGWPDPIIALSGNGIHLLNRIDLPTADGGVVERVLAGLADRFDDDHVEVDRVVHNAARITKVIGTMARKGDNVVGVVDVEDRPHRRAALVSVPAEMQAVPLALLERVAAPQRPNPAAPARTPVPQAGVAGPAPFERFDHTPDGVRGYLERHGLSVTRQHTKRGRTWLHLDRCPVVADCVSGGGTDISVVVGPNGTIGFKNQHTRGKGLTWLDVRESLESGYKAHAESMWRAAPSTACPDLPSFSGPCGINLTAIQVHATPKRHQVRFRVAVDGHDTQRELVATDTPTGLRRALTDLTEIVDRASQGRTLPAGHGADFNDYLGKLLTSQSVAEMTAAVRAHDKAARGEEPADAREPMLDIATRLCRECWDLRFVNPDGTAWSERKGRPVRPTEFVNWIDPEMLTALAAARDYPAPTPSDPTKPIKQAAQVLKPVWPNLVKDLPNEVGATDLGPNSKAAAQFRQHMNTLWLSPETWMKFDRANEYGPEGTHVARMSLASRAREMARQASDRPSAWRQVLPGVNAFFRVERGAGGQSPVWLGMRYDLCLGQIKGQRIPNVGSQKDLTTLMRRYGVADESGIADRIHEGESQPRLAVMSREVCDHLLDCVDVATSGPVAHTEERGFVPRGGAGERIDPETGEVLDDP